MFTPTHRYTINTVAVLFVADRVIPETQTKILLLFSKTAVDFAHLMTDELDKKTKQTEPLF